MKMESCLYVLNVLYEWDPNEVAEEEGLVVLDSNGTRLADGDTVTVIKDLKVKGAPKDIKQGYTC